MKKLNSKAFTLAEMMVSILILGIFIAVAATTIVTLTRLQYDSIADSDTQTQLYLLEKTITTKFNEFDISSVTYAVGEYINTSTSENNANSFTAAQAISGESRIVGNAISFQTTQNHQLQDDLVIYFDKNSQNLVFNYFDNTQINQIINYEYILNIEFIQQVQLNLAQQPPSVNENLIMCRVTYSNSADQEMSYTFTIVKHT